MTPTLARFLNKERKHSFPLTHVSRVVPAALTRWSEFRNGTNNRAKKRPGGARGVRTGCISVDYSFLCRCSSICLQEVSHGRRTRLEINSPQRHAKRIGNNKVSGNDRYTWRGRAFPDELSRPRRMKRTD